MWDSIKSFLEKVLVPWLAPFFGALNHFLNRMPPWSWTLAVCVFLTAGTLWALFLSKESIYAGAPSRAPWRDLRFWLILLLLPYLLVYLLF